VSGPVLSIDYGDKKIGLAISSPNRSMSAPLAVIKNISIDSLCASIQKIITGKNISGIVIGLPLHQDGNESISSKKVKVFSEKLDSFFNLPLYLQEERRTTKAADSLLKIAGFNRKTRNEVDDSVAACLILDSVLQKIENK
ncbi:MAG: Holliday junction resolvase RuvX, partial [Rickettsiaceae bacterium]|nr:Holliday junction resolvase RuvX [Rickettsiaceae bacterium]